MELRNEIIAEQRSYLDKMAAYVKIQLIEAKNLKDAKSLTVKSKKDTNKLKHNIKRILQPFLSWSCYKSLVYLTRPAIDLTKYLPAIFE